MKNKKLSILIIGCALAILMMTTTANAEGLQKTDKYNTSITQKQTVAKKNKKDEKNLKKLIVKLRKNGAKVSKNLNSKTYKWDKETGKLKSINWTKKKIKGKLNLNQFKSLETIKVENNKITNLQVNQLKKLTTLTCNNNNLKYLSVKNCENLKKLYCNNNQLTTLKLKGATRLGTLNCSHNKLKKLVVDSGYIRILKCSYNEITSLDINEDNYYEFIDCRYNKIEEICVKNLSAADDYYVLKCDSYVRAYDWDYSIRYDKYYGVDFVSYQYILKDAFDEYFYEDEYYY